MAGTSPSPESSKMDASPTRVQTRTRVWTRTRVFPTLENTLHVDIGCFQTHNRGVHGKRRTLAPEIVSLRYEKTMLSLPSFRL